MDMEIEMSIERLRLVEGDEYEAKNFEAQVEIDS